MMLCVEISPLLLLQLPSIQSRQDHGTRVVQIQIKGRQGQSCSRNSNSLCIGSSSSGRAACDATRQLRNRRSSSSIMVCQLVKRSLAEVISDETKKETSYVFTRTFCWDSRNILHQVVQLTNTTNRQTDRQSDQAEEPSFITIPPSINYYCLYSQVLWGLLWLYLVCNFDSLSSK